MALTLEAEQRLTDVGVVQFYEDDADAWYDVVADTKDFIDTQFPEGSLVRRDDVAKALIPVLEVHEGFKDFRNSHKLRQKFWIRDFADLLIDKTWEMLDDEDGDENQE